MSSEPPLSFYGVYDGHAGKDAAAFSASQLHGKILASTSFPTDMVQAIKDAFKETDDVFLQKCETEVGIPMVSKHSSSKFGICCFFILS